MKKTDFVTQILSPLPFEGDIICIGTNYREHAKEANVRPTYLSRCYCRPTLSGLLIY